MDRYKTDHKYTEETELQTHIHTQTYRVADRHTYRHTATDNEYTSHNGNPAKQSVSAKEFVMAAKGKAIIFYRSDLFFFHFVSIDERQAMGSQTNLDSTSEVMTIYKCPQKIWGTKTSHLLPLFSPTSALDTAFLRNEKSHQKTKRSVNLQCVP